MFKKNYFKVEAVLPYLPICFKELVILSILIIGVGCQKDQNDLVLTGNRAEKILEATGISRGIFVLLDDKKCDVALDLVQKSELVVYCPLTKDEDVKEARLAVDSAGFYGTRIYVEKSVPEKINLADNIADALIAIDDNRVIDKKEILRVLRPNGKAWIRQKQLVKPQPENVDDWSHPYHGPDNNTQSRDLVIKAPYLTQFLAEPHYGPAVQVTVASNGLVFKGFGNIAFHEREEEFLNTLVAFNGYNGTMLWKRDLVPGIMLHRNTMIATPKILYVADDKSCKLIEPETGRQMGEITPDPEISGGTFWKWMGLEDGVLYALIGEQEQKDPVMRWRRQVHGWPWTAISKGFNQAEHTWGFGHDFLALDPQDGEILWHHHEDEAIDSRALCLTNERIYLFRFGAYLTCLNARSGSVVWRKTPDDSPELFAAIGEYLPRQSYDTNWRTRNYMLSSDDALYFAGPQIDKLLAVSTKDGSVLWEDPYNNYQLVLREDGLYAISGERSNNVSKKFDPLTGIVLAELPTCRRACTRPNAANDAIFFRANDGSVRFDLATNRPEWISPMRPSCQDGVTIANGMLYWWPYVCDCQLSLYGVTALGAAGDYDFRHVASVEERLEKGEIDIKTVPELLTTTSDWPTFRQNNNADVSTDALISLNGYPLWKYPDIEGYYTATNVLGHPHYTLPTAPVTADGLLIYGSTDGSIIALNVMSGQLLWKAYTGGAIRIPPTLYKGYVLAGSGDGYVYNFAARTGELLWKFRAAPVDRKIPVYGRLLSTWPVASGIRVQDETAYFAAGIVNYDGTHVYGLDVVSGKIKWQNNTSGHLDPEARTGASVLGHLICDDENLYMASGTSLSPAIYKLSNGECLNNPEPLKYNASYSPRGWELFRIGDHVVAAGKPYYSHPKHEIYDVTVENKMLHCSNGKRDILWINQKKIICYPPIDKKTLNGCVSPQKYSGYLAPIWGNLDIKVDPYWEYFCEGSQAVAMCKNAVIVAEKTKIVVLDLNNGKVLWSHPLPYAPVPWGMAVSRDGKIIVTLEDGSVQCFGGEQMIPTPYISSHNTYFVGEAVVTLACDTKPGEIYFTLDGSEPTKQSRKYTKPFKIDQSITMKMRAFSPTQAPGFVVTEDFKKVNYALAGDPGDIKLGIDYEYYSGSFQSVNDLERKIPVQSGIMNRITFGPGLTRNEFGYKYSGFILIPEDGIYTFYLESNDGSKLYLNNEELIDNDGGHTAVEKSAKIALKAGEYPIIVKYFQMGGAKALKVSWESDKIAKEEITAEVLFHKE